MFRLFAAIAMAMWNLAKATGSGFVHGLDWSWRNFWGLFGFGGGGGSATPGPLDLPSKEVFEVDRSLAEGQQRAADILANDSPARQIKLFASAKPDDRFGVDLSLLDPAQQDWLTSLSTNDKAMRSLSEAPESKIMMLLSGHDGIVPGLDAPKPEKPREVIPGLVSRMEDFRMKLACREGNNVLAA